MSEIPLDPATPGGLAQDRPAPSPPAAPLVPPPSAVPTPPAAEPFDSAQGKDRPRSRGWFVALAWVTLILFGIFILGITLSVIFIPELRKAKIGSVYERERSKIQDQRAEGLGESPQTPLGKGPGEGSSVLPRGGAGKLPRAFALGSLIFDLSETRPS